MTEPNSQTWAVTGAAGYLGSHVDGALLARGTPVLAVDDFSVGRLEHLAAHRDNPLFRLVEANVRNAPVMAALFREHRPAAVVHLAAIHYIPACNADPPRAVGLNVHGTQCVLTACRAADVERFWFASTGGTSTRRTTPRTVRTTLPHRLPFTDLPIG